MLLTRLFVVGAVLLVTSCSTSPPAAAPPAAAVAPVPAPAPAVWQPCGDGFDCTRVRVPVDYTQPAGPSIELAIVRHAATDRARRIGTLFLNQGGPGAPADDLVRALGTPEGPFGPEVVARYDLVGMDPRGVGGSAPVVCRENAEREAILALEADLALPGGRPVPVLEAEARDLAADCWARVDPALLAQLSTDVVARDMDQVRLALGEEKIGYYGLSYGTVLGAVYATFFPARVARMVLDAPAHPQRWLSDPLGSNVEQTVSAEAVLNRYLATCAAEAPACAFGNGRPAEAFDALVARLEASPIVFRPTNLPEIRVDGARLLLAARTAVFVPELWPGLTNVLIEAEAGNGDPAVALSQLLERNPDGTPNALSEANFAVNCLDRAHPTDLDAYRRSAEEAVAAAPRFGEQAGYALLACAYWPASNPDRYLGPLTGAGAPPILVVGGREDPQTPYPWAEELSRSLAGSVLLTRDGPGHGALGSGPCSRDAVTGYLTTGAMPATGTVCPRDPAPSTVPFGPISSGPDTAPAPR